jgi:hypothetical protein
MMKSSLANNENSTDLPCPLVRVEVNMVTPPHPSLLPPGERGTIGIIF